MANKSDEVMKAEQATRDALLPERMDVLTKDMWLRQCRGCWSSRVLLRLNYNGLHDAQHQWFCENCTWVSAEFHNHDNWPGFIQFFRPAYEYRAFDSDHRCTTLRPPSPYSEAVFRDIKEYLKAAQGRIAAAQGLYMSATRGEEPDVTDLVALVLAAVDKESQ